MQPVVLNRPYFLRSRHRRGEVLHGTLYRNAIRVRDRRRVNLGRLILRGVERLRVQPSRRWFPIANAPDIERRGELSGLFSAAFFDLNVFPLSLDLFSDVDARQCDLLQTDQR
jgi:hypothetical protein